MTSRDTLVYIGNDIACDYWLPTPVGVSYDHFDSDLATLFKINKTFISNHFDAYVYA